MLKCGDAFMGIHDTRVQDDRLIAKVSGFGEPFVFSLEMETGKKQSLRITGALEKDNAYADSIVLGRETADKFMTLQDDGQHALPVTFSAFPNQECCDMAQCIRFHRLHNFNTVPL